ncbi:MAG: MMPL family transporter, partial [Acidobacteriota bacterium]|nr:MMPL family transporter [Acidobacteriota bacterium]
MSRRAWLWVLMAAVVITGLAVIPALRLRISSTLVDLLPEGEPAAEDYREFLETFGGFETIYLIVQLPEDSPGSADVLAEAADLLADRLESSPWISTARSGPTDEDERFFLEEVLPRAALLIEESRLEPLSRRLRPEAIQERLSWMRLRLTTPIGSAEEALYRSDPLGLAELLDLFPGGEGLSVDPVTGAFLSHSGTRALVMATPVASELDSRSGQELLEQIEMAYTEVREALGQDLTFLEVGGPLYAAQDARLIRADLERTVAFSAVGISLLLFFYFGGFRIAVILVSAVIAGILWTAALVAVGPGELSVISVSFAAILIGLGVDYGVHGATGFLQARLRGLDPSNAMLRALRQRGPAIIASVLTTVAAFLVLRLAHFRPIRDLGLLVSVGMVAIISASLTIAAPALVVSSGPRISADRGRIHGTLGRAVGALARMSVAHHRKIIGIAAVLVLLAIWGTLRIGFDVDPRLFRSTDHPSAAAEEVLDEDFS